MKKKLFIILGIIAVILVVAISITIYFVDRSKYDFKVLQISEINYHVIYQDNRYGVINRNGEIVVEPTYNAIQIPNPSVDIFICMYEYNSIEKEYQTKALNSKGEELYQGYDNVQAISTKTTYDEIPFEKSVLKYKKDGKYGLLSMKGKELTKPIYDEISAIPYKEGMLLVKQGDNCGVINMNGKTLIPVEYATIIADNYYSTETASYKRAGYIVSKKTEEGYRYRIY